MVNRDRSVTRLVDSCEHLGISERDSFLVGGRVTVVNLWPSRTEFEVIIIWNLESGENN